MSDPPHPADTERLDQRGNTPLMLAYRLRRTKAAMMLLAAGAYAKPRTKEHFECIHVAALTGDADLTRTAVIAFLKETDAAFTRRLPSLQAALEKLPDFTLRMSWNFTSWVPLVTRMLPSDTFVIYKRGSSIRLDSTLLQMNGLTWERGSISIVIWGRDMPRPGAMFVLDNELKTAAEGRLAFTHPADISQQDWVRKLLTAKQKSTDYWSRDTVLVPVKQQGFFGGLSSALSRVVLGDDTPRGRISEGSTSPTPDSIASSSGSPRKSKASDGTGSGGSSPITGAGFTGAPSPTNAFTTAPMVPESPSSSSGGGGGILHVDDPRQLKEDVGVWHGCSVYEMRNLCVRDLTHPPVQGSLPLSSWWRDEYSIAATDADLAASERAARGIADSALPPEDEAPEAKLGLLHKALTAIQEGRIKDLQSATSIESVDLDADASGVSTPTGSSSSKKGTSGPTSSVSTTYTFEEYFGQERHSPTIAMTRSLSAGSTGSRSHHFHSDGLQHLPSALVREHKKEALAVEDKTLDVRMYFSKQFPITPTDFLPVAELMARTTSHASNFRVFFERKMPQGAGFPVKVSRACVRACMCMCVCVYVNVRMWLLWT